MQENNLLWCNRSGSCCLPEKKEKDFHLPTAAANQVYEELPWLAQGYIHRNSGTDGQGSPSLAVFLCSEATSPVQSTTCEIYYVCYIYAIYLSRYIAYIYIHTYLLYTWHKLELFLIYVFGAVIWYVIFSTHRANRLQSSSTHGAPMAKEVNDQTGTGTATPSGHSPQKASGLERTKPA